MIDDRLIGERKIAGSKDLADPDDAFVGVDLNQVGGPLAVVPLGKAKLFVHVIL